MSCIYKTTIVAPTITDDLCGASRLTSVFIVDCGDANENPTCQSLWNSRRCQADNPYSRLVSNGQTLSMQFRFRDNRNNWGNLDPTTNAYAADRLPSIILPSPVYGWRQTPTDPNYLVDIELVDCDCEPIDFDLRPFITGWVGKYNQRHYQTVRFDIGDIPFSCFAFKVTTWDGRTAFTECYSKEICEETVCIAAMDTDVTCYGTLLSMPVRPGDPRSSRTELQSSINFYLGDMNPHELSICFEGKNAESQYQINKEAKNVFVSNMELSKISRLVSAPLPDFEAKTVSEILSSNRILHAGESWQYTGTLSGKMENSNMWQLDFNIQQFVCSKKFGCS